MKRVINGRRYDTDTAVLTASTRARNCYVNDFAYYEEDLYRKKTGEYFLVGFGGPMSHYSRSIGQNTWSGGSNLVPIDIEDAKGWVERNSTLELYEELFGAVVD